ncbi:pyridoxal phosphate-dependent aminotransferase [Kitasatospora aureofaciens]|uniref:aminotransferase class I/II-fold pyridoxal phosphate-dependent enzyme n=1 Tax=Kitasatospora aureofaciens TaxID=1894 RepID=UPI001C4536C0|nr:pyridoxal phosphate-dependent aminotransferase [Kitasatospora aureofaciens]MBV6702007.1 pyridoxal phosphate-dependent aminotransferase [Kitasatospora aureofaciens]
MTNHDAMLASPEAAADLLGRLPDLEQALAFYHRHLASRTAIDLSVAENILVFEHSMQKKVFEDIKLIPETSIKYSASAGTPKLREQVADLLTLALGATVEGDDVFGVAGVSSALECVAFALKGRDPVGPPLKDGDLVLLPAPYWQGFNWSFEERPKLKCVPVNLPTTGPDRYRLTLAQIKQAYRDQTTPDRAPRLLVLTNPHNPLGVNYSRALLEEIYTWVLNETDMHIISDEIYCHSQLDSSTTKFTSALALDAYREQPDRVHVVWGFAKDFGLSGFRTGFVVSQNTAVRRAMLGSDDPSEATHPLPWFTPFDSLKTYVIGELLSAPADGPTSELYTTYAMREYSKLLSASFRTVRAALDAAGIEYVHHEGDNAAQFFWLDLTKYLGKRPDHSHEEDAGPMSLGAHGLDPDEERLFDYLRAKPTEVSLLPGGVMHNSVPGYFRLCYTARQPEEVRAAVQRVGKALGQLK